VRRWTPNRLVSRIVRKISSSVASMLAHAATPALLIKTSIVPAVSVVMATARVTELGSFTSNGMTSASGIGLASSGHRIPANTRSPVAANALAVARPMPLLDPLINTFTIRSSHATAPLEPETVSRKRPGSAVCSDHH
jgi:hypothetical protein